LRLLGHKTPVEMDAKAHSSRLRSTSKATGGGSADVVQRSFRVGIQGQHKDLDAAYAQLLAYRGGLDNPPLLVVCDFLEYRIYPQWPNISGQPIVFHNEDLLNREAQNYIRWLLESPDKFLELRQSEKQAREQLTVRLADKFAHLADLMRHHTDQTGRPLWEPMQIARFLTKLVLRCSPKTST
jgi:hypothetical protein